MGRQQRWTILIIAVLTGLVICAVPLMLRSTSSHNDAHSGAAISDNPAGQGSGSQGDGGQGDPSGGSGDADSPASNPASGRPACPTAGADTASNSSEDANSPLASVTLPGQLRKQGRCPTVESQPRRQTHRDQPVGLLVPAVQEGTPDRRQSGPVPPGVERRRRARR